MPAGKLIFVMTGPADSATTVKVKVCVRDVPAASITVVAIL